MRRGCYGGMLLVLLLPLGCRKSAAPPEKKDIGQVLRANADQPGLTPEQKLNRTVDGLAALLEMPEDRASQAEVEIGADNVDEVLSRLEAEISAEDSPPTTK